MTGDCNSINIGGVSTLQETGNLRRNGIPKALSARNQSNGFNAGAPAATMHIGRGAFGTFTATRAYEYIIDNKGWSDEQVEFYEKYIGAKYALPALIPSATDVSTAPYVSGLINTYTLKPTPVAADQVYIADSSASNAIKRATLTTLPPAARYCNIYIDPPASPNAFDDEFELSSSGSLASEDLATRGWTVVNAVTGATLTRTGPVDFFASPAGIGATVYRSTIRNSRLYFQASVSVYFFKAFTGSGQLVGLVNQPNVQSGNVCTVRISNNTTPGTSGSNRSIYAGQENANVVVAYNNQGAFNVPLNSGYGGVAQGVCAVLDYDDSSKNFIAFLQQPYNGTMTYNGNAGITATSMSSVYAGMYVATGSGQVRNWVEIDYMRRYPIQSWFPA
jgi:hypothetical protein